MRHSLFTLPLLLAACSQEPSVSVENATPEEVAKEVAKSGAETLIEPGQWEYQMTLVEMSAPGMPPAMVDRMKQTMSASKVVDKCLRPDDVKKMEAAVAEMPGNCRYDHYTMAGGQIDGRMTCTNNGVTSEMTVKGSYSPGSSDVTVTNRMTGGQGSMANMTMTMNMKGKRVGACAAESGAGN